METPLTGFTKVEDETETVAQQATCRAIFGPLEEILFVKLVLTILTVAPDPISTALWTVVFEKIFVRWISTVPEESL